MKRQVGYREVMWDKGEQVMRGSGGAGGDGGGGGAGGGKKSLIIFPIFR